MEFKGTQLTKEEFFSYILKRDIIIRSVGEKLPYATHFKSRNGDLVGICDENKNYFLDIDAVKLIKEHK